MVHPRIDYSRKTTRSKQESFNENEDDDDDREGTTLRTSYLVTPAGIFLPFTVIAWVTEYCFNSSGLMMPNCNFFIRRRRAEE
jgi:hypothetical protein